MLFCHFTAGISFSCSDKRCFVSILLTETNYIWSSYCIERTAEKTHYFDIFIRLRQAMAKHFQI